MAATADNFEIFGSAAMPEVDAGSAGGAILLTRLMRNLSMITPESPSIISDDSADTMDVTAHGIVAGAYDTEQITMTGLTIATFSKSFSSVYKLVFSSQTVGNVDFRRNDQTTSILLSGGVAHLIPPGIDEVRAYFPRINSSASEDFFYYEKVFLRNTHATDTISTVKLTLLTDPGSRLRFTPGGPTDTAATRVSSPTNPSWQDGAQVYTIGDLAAGASQGIWIELNVDAGETVANTVFDWSVEGNILGA